MGKIGIITFHKASSYGAVMQSLALQRAMESIGKEVEIINYHSPYMSPQKQMFADFCERYLKLSRPYRNVESISTEAYDTVITGSDQVWNTELINDPAFFLSFAKEGVKRGAYSASVGVNFEFLEKLDEKIFAKYIPEFDAISIRESVHMSYVQQFAKCKVHTTIDPVFLLQGEDYDKLFGAEKQETCSTKIKPKEYIFYHGIGLSAKLVDFLNLLSNYTGYQIIAVSDYEKFHFGSKAIVLQNVSPEEWIYYIKNAKLVLTNSYHTMLFSILYGVPFYAHTAKQHANVTRLLEVIDILGLQDRKLMNVRNISEATFEIDYDRVHEKLREKRADAYKYLRDVVG